LPHVREIWGDQPDARCTELAYSVGQEDERERLVVRPAQRRNDVDVAAGGIRIDTYVGLTVGKVA
jgi:hypothetical protein